ncbi:MAG: alpha/beta fold hydrolase [Actinomycetota bacterium]
MIPRIHVLDRGAGDPVLFVHGWLNDHTVWNGVVEALESSHRCLAVDLRGHGESEAAGAGNYGREQVLDDLRRVLDERGIERTAVVGHSLGGYLALALAIEDPSRVSALGLVAAGPGFRNPESREQWNESVQATAEGRDIPEGMEVISMHVDAMVMDRLGEIEVPACVIVGERDRRFLTSADIFGRYLDVRTNVVVEGMGHMVHAKAPADVAAALRTVLD